MGKWTRRAVLSAGALAGGGIIVGVALRPGSRVDELSNLVTEGDETLMHTYVKIDNNNVVTAIVPHSEMGQGAQTALAQMLADELDADWSKVEIEEAPAVGEYSNYTLGRGYLFKDADLPSVVIPTVEGVMMRVADAIDMQVTGGSLSVRVTGQYGMRVVGAATRDMLKRAAANEWQVPFEEVTTADSHVMHAASSRTEPYATFASAAAEMTPSYTPTLKQPEDFKIIGHHVPRLDIPSKVDGTAKFALDVRRPDMVYATVVRTPVFGGSIATIDDAATRAVRGVMDVVPLPNTSADPMIGKFTTGEAVAVVADSYWTARNGLAALKVTWDGHGNEVVSSESIFDQFDRDITSAKEREQDRKKGDVEEAFADATQEFEADYQVPYLAHACMEPLNATAEVKDGHCDVWVGCQNPLGFRRAVADSLGMKMEDVMVHNHFMGGGFGRKSRADYAIQAALIAKAIGRPVQLIWSREEDMRQDFYRPAVQSRFRAGLDDSGKPIAWHNTYIGKFEPIEAPLIPYGVPAQDIGYVMSPNHVPIGAWRSVDHSQHGFFTESFMDELANAADADPFEFRASLLEDEPRHLAVLKRAAKEAGWDRPLAEGRGRGIALQESFGSIVALVAEITVDDGEVAVDRIVAAMDPGIAVSPDGVAAQLESGIIFALSAALYGEIKIEEGAAVQSNFHDYEVVRMDDAPTIETHIINSGHAIGGAGEPGVPCVAPAVANALFNATGKRARRLPLSQFS